MLSIEFVLMYERDECLYFQVKRFMVDCLLMGSIYVKYTHYIALIFKSVVSEFGSRDGDDEHEQLLTTIFCLLCAQFCIEYNTFYN